MIVDPAIDEEGKPWEGILVLPMPRRVLLGAARLYAQAPEQKPRYRHFAPASMSSSST
jgi:hypothetical protein